MVGEIRDGETAEIALKAAQTGHLVLSTLHTNSTSETLVRLQQMGVARWMIASALTLVIAQRLVRKLCPHCRQRQSTPITLPKTVWPTPLPNWQALAETIVITDFMAVRHCLKCSLLLRHYVRVLPVAHQ